MKKNILFKVLLSIVSLQTYSQSIILQESRTDAFGCWTKLSQTKRQQKR